MDLKCRRLTEMDRRSLIPVALLVLILIFLHTGYGRQSIDYFTEDDLYKSNLHYLEEHAASSTSNFVFLSSLNAIFASIQTSEVGVKFIIQANIDIGKELSTLTNLTGVAAKNAAVSAAASLILADIVVIAEMVTPWVLSGLFCSVLLYFVLRALKYKRSRCRIFVFTRSLVIVACLVHLVIPYAIHMSAVINKAAHDDSSSEYFKNMHSDIAGQNQHADAKKRSLYLFKLYEKSVLNIMERIEELLKHTIRYVLNGLVYLVLLPLVLGFLLHRLFVKLLTHAFVHPLEKLTDELS